MTGGRMTGGRMTGGRITGGRITGGRITGGRITGGRITGGRITVTVMVPVMVIVSDALDGSVAVSVRVYVSSAKSAVGLTLICPVSSSITNSLDALLKLYVSVSPSMSVAVTGSPTREPGGAWSDTERWAVLSAKAGASFAGVMVTRTVASDPFPLTSVRV